jgi:hypothetical protein
MLLALRAPFAMNLAGFIINGTAAATTSIPHFQSDNKFSGKVCTLQLLCPDYKLYSAQLDMSAQGVLAADILHQSGHSSLGPAFSENAYAHMEMYISRVSGHYCIF